MSSAWSKGFGTATSVRTIGEPAAKGEAAQRYWAEREGAVWSTSATPASARWKTTPRTASIASRPGAEAELREGDQWSCENDRGRGHDRGDVQNVQLQFCRDLRVQLRNLRNRIEPSQFVVFVVKQMVTGSLRRNCFGGSQDGSGARAAATARRAISSFVVAHPAPVLRQRFVEVAVARSISVKRRPLGQDVIDETIAFEQDLPVDLDDHLRLVTMSRMVTFAALGCDGPRARSNRGQAVPPARRRARPEQA